MTPALELDKVSKRLTEHFAVRNVSFRLVMGRCLGLVGPSGAGKTTILRLIAGLEVPDKGRIIIDEKAVSEAGSSVSPHRRGVGLVFQDLALWPHMTVEKQVYLCLDQGLPRDKRWQKTRATLDRLDLGSHSGKYPAQLSGGEGQRVALARALVAEPGVLLLDEPLANLDRSLRRSLLELLADLKTEGSVSLVYVSHDREGLSSLTDEIAILDRGELVEQGSTVEVLSSPKSPVGKSLLLD
jgi:iron(III) transport system ATP-binding protein